MTQVTSWRVRKNGDYWILAWRDEHGDFHRESLCSKKKAPRRRDAELVASKRVRELGEPAPLPAASIGAWVDRYDSIQVAEKLAPRTISLQRHTGRLLVEYFGAEKRMHEITHKQATTWSQWVANKLGIKLNTIRAHNSRAKACFARAVVEGEAHANPFERLKSSRTRVEKTVYCVSPEEVEKLIEACPDSKWRAAVGLAAYAGLRCNEVCRAEWGDVHWETERLVVRTKTHEADGTRRETTKSYLRDTPITPELLRILQDRHEDCEPGETRICPLVYSSSYQNLRRIIERAGMTPWPECWHALKKFRATLYAVEDVPTEAAAEWLGDSPDVLRRHYIRLPEWARQRIAQRQTRLEDQEREIERLKKLLEANGLAIPKVSAQKAHKMTGDSQ